MKTVRFLALAFLSLILMTACDSTGIDQSAVPSESSVQETEDSPDAESEPLMPDKQLLGSDYKELESKRKSNRRVFERADGKRVAIIRSVTVKRKRKGEESSKDTRYATDQSRSFYRYIDSKVLDPYDDPQLKTTSVDQTTDDGSKAAKSGTFDYSDTPYELVGNLPTYDNTYSMEVFRLGLRFSGFSGLNVGTVNDIRFEFDPNDAFPATDRRDGNIEVLEYDSDPTSQFGEQSVFEALAQGDQLFQANVKPEDTLYDFSETYTSGDNFFDYFEPAVKGGNEISISVVAEDESTSGAALSMDFIDLVVTYDPPAQAPTSPPSLLSPSDGATVRTAANLDWSTVSASPSADYTVQLDEDPNFGSPRTQTVSSSSATFGNLTVGETYYWRVKAFNSEGSTSFSGSRSFTRGEDLLQVSIDGPGSVISGNTDTWSANVDGGTGSYSYQWEAKNIYYDYETLGTGSSATYQFAHSENYQQNGYIRVTVDSGVQTKTVEKRVSVKASSDDACKSAGKIVDCT